MSKSYGNYGRRRKGSYSRPKKKKTYNQRILQLTRDLCRIEQGLKNSDSKVHEVFNETLNKTLDGKKAKKTLF